MGTVKSLSVMWTPRDGIGLEDCRIRHLHHNRKVEPIEAPFGKIQRPMEAIEVSGFILGTQDEDTFRLEYHIVCDMHIGFHEFHLHCDCGARRFDSPVFLTDGGGKWWNHRWRQLTEFDGCTTIDIMHTPLTNMLAIRQLGLAVGQAATIKVVYIDGIEGRLTPEEQLYTCIEKSARGSVYQFEQLSSGFTSIIPFDENDLVIDYPDLFRRVYPKVSDI